MKSTELTLQIRAKNLASKGLRELQPDFNIPEALEGLANEARKYESFEEFEEAITVEYPDKKRGFPAWDFQLGKTEKAEKLFQDIREYQRHEVIFRRKNNLPKMTEDIRKEYKCLKEAIKKMDIKEAISQLHFAAYYGGEHGPSPKISNISRDVAHILYRELVGFADLKSFWQAVQMAECELDECVEGKVNE